MELKINTDGEIVSGVEVGLDSQCTGAHAFRTYIRIKI